MSRTSKRQLQPRNQRNPLRTFFVITSMPVGGAEVLLSNLIRRLDRKVIEPHLICLKELGELGNQITNEVPTWHDLLASKWDLRILPKLSHIFRQKQADAVITVGAGDKMFWGRVAARQTDVPVVCSALHSTGWPDGVGRLNRWLTPWTDAFIAVAQAHGEHLAKHERFPEKKVHIIPNGVDTNRFKPNPEMRRKVRRGLHLPESAPLVGIVAALRPEKNHTLLVRAAVRILTDHPQTHFLIIGEGPQRTSIEQQIADLGLQHRFHLLGNRHDTPDLLAALDVFTLCSLNEANPVSILESLSTGVPVVSTNVGSIHETVVPNETGILVPSEDTVALAQGVSRLLGNPKLAKQLGSKGRQRTIDGWSLNSMVEGYENLICRIYDQKVGVSAASTIDLPATVTPPRDAIGYPTSPAVWPNLSINTPDSTSTLPN